MARRRSTAARVTTKRSGGTTAIVVSPPAPAPIQRRRTSSGGIRRRRGGRSYLHRRGGSSQNVQSRLTKVLLGGFAYGILVKTFPDIPRIPGIGRSGTVALAVYLMKPSSQLLQDLGVAAAAIAGSTFGETGTVAGFSDDDVLQA